MSQSSDASPEHRALPMASAAAHHVAAHRYVEPRHSSTSGDGGARFWYRPTDGSGWQDDHPCRRRETFLRFRIHASPSSLKSQLARCSCGDSCPRLPVERSSVLFRADGVLISLVGFCLIRPRAVSPTRGAVSQFACEPQPLDYGTTQSAAERLNL